ncbi:hypothetical protein KW791_01175 [Candidatus Parcubacteria bacterium]|nr:hypothetical protein [Candidatus Parcubacteria bacterium]
MIVYFGFFALILGFIYLWQINSSVAAAKSNFFVSNTTKLPFKLPTGFSISYFAKHLHEPSALTWDNAGNLLVAERSANQIVALKDRNHDGISEDKIVIVRDIRNPTAIAVKCSPVDKSYLDGTIRELDETGIIQNSCHLYVKSPKGVSAYDYDAQSSKAIYAGDVIMSDHEWFKLIGNTAQAETTEDLCQLTENQALCDDSSKTFLNLAKEERSPSMALVPINGWPTDYQYNVLVAYPGADNGSAPTGYKVARYKYDSEGGYLGQEDFISGWLSGGKILGKPTSLLVGPDNASYITDLYVADATGSIFRVSYRGQFLSKHNKGVLTDRMEKSN